MVLRNSEAFSDITNYLAVGKADTHGGPTMSQLKDQYGFSVVVDLNDRKSEAPAAKRAGLKYVGKKTPFIPDPALMEQLSKTIDKEIEAGHRVYVHCHKGIYRSATIAVAYLIYKGMKTDAAVKKVKERRPTALPGIENSEKLVPEMKKFEDKVRAQIR